MRIVKIIAGILWLSAGLLAQPESVLTPGMQNVMESKGETETISAWIFFADKGTNIAENLQHAEAQLTPRAYQRRLRNRGAGNLVDYYDLPVNSQYVQEIAKRVERIRYKSRWFNALSVEVKKSTVHEIAELAFVKKIDLVYIQKIPMPDWPLLNQPSKASAPSSGNDGTQILDYGASFTQNDQINVPALHNMGYDGSGVIIAMMDAGFNNPNHEAFAHLDILKTWDFANGDSIVYDEPGQLGVGDHGTLTLSALAGFSQGNLIGPAYGASFLLARTEIHDPSNPFERHLEEDNWVAGAEWADSLGADLISSSLGYRDGFTHGDTNYTWMDMDGNTTIITIGADIAASRGILVVNSAGNEGSATPPQNTLIAPADGDSVMAVGAVTSSGTRTSFSSMGPTADGRIKPDVMAMGSFVVSASPNDPYGYTFASGTSLSCPLAAGAAALLLQANPSATNMEILGALRNTASNSGNPNNQYGWGIIDAHAAAFSITGIVSEYNHLAESIELYPAYPNPFNPVTTIRYRLPGNGDISLFVYNLLGQAVTTLFTGSQTAGEHQLTWNAQGLPSGIYYIVLAAGQQQTVQKAILMK